MNLLQRLYKNMAISGDISVRNGDLKLLSHVPDDSLSRFLIVAESERVQKV
jgi:hypothetical protein